MHNHNIVATTGTYTAQDGQKKYINKTIYVKEKNKSAASFPK